MLTCTKAIFLGAFLVMTTTIPVICHSDIPISCAFVKIFSANEETLYFPMNECMYKYETWSCLPNDVNTSPSNQLMGTVQRTVYTQEGCVGPIFSATVFRKYQNRVTKQSTSGQGGIVPSANTQVPSVATNPPVAMETTRAPFQSTSAESFPANNNGSNFLASNLNSTQTQTQTQTQSQSTPAGVPSHFITRQEIIPAPISSTLAPNNSNNFTQHFGGGKRRLQDSGEQLSEGAESVKNNRVNGVSSKSLSEEFLQKGYEMDFQCMDVNGLNPLQVCGIKFAEFNDSACQNINSVIIHTVLNGECIDLPGSSESMILGCLSRNSIEVSIFGASSCHGNVISSHTLDATCNGNALQTISCQGPVTMLSPEIQQTTTSSSSVAPQNPTTPNTGNTNANTNASGVNRLTATFALIFVVIGTLFY